MGVETEIKKEDFQRKNGLKNLLILAFALSGMTALIYEIVWIRPLQLIFGSTVYAISTILTSFMFGFALGSYSFRNIADRVKNPILVFAGLELGIGIYGVLILLIFNILPSIYLHLLNIPGFQFLQFLLCFLVIIIPASLFGATWPVVNKAYSSMNELGKDTGLLYSFNSLGAVIGSLGAGFVFIPLLGIIKSSFFAAFLNLLVAVSLYLWGRNKNEI